jgi:hypothetical protein
LWYNLQKAAFFFVTYFCGDDGCMQSPIAGG